MLLLLLVLLGWPVLSAAAEPVLVSDVSDPKVQIRYSFHGATEMIFGAILYPQGQQPSGPIDMAVVLRGPSQSIRVREKQKLAGLIWVNADETRFRSAPGFYAIATTRPLNQIISPLQADIYELGVDELQLSPASGMAPADANRFERGLIGMRTQNLLYASRPGTVQITGGVLFRAQLDIPARAPVGLYTADAFLIRHGHVIAATSHDIDIRKIGFERFVARAADSHPLIYGIIAVLLSIGVGWGAGELFKQAGGR